MPKWWMKNRNGGITFLACCQCRKNGSKNWCRRAVDTKFIYIRRNMAISGGLCTHKYGNFWRVMYTHKYGNFWRVMYTQIWQFLEGYVHTQIWQFLEGYVHTNMAISGGLCTHKYGNFWRVMYQLGAGDSIILKAAWAKGTLIHHDGYTKISHTY